MGQFGDMLGQQVAGATGGLISTGLGLLLEGHNDRRQLRQQRALTEIQEASNKRLSDYNAAQQLKMWHETNYSAQKEELEKAGLNPGLLYGLSGGGATTVGGGAQSASGGTAQGVSNESMQFQQLGIQMQLAKAQAAALEAKANLDNTTAKNIGEGGIDTEVKQTTINALTAGIDNTKAQTQLTNVQSKIAEIEKTIKESSSMDVIKQIDLTAQRLQQEVIQFQNNTEISNETKQAKIQQIKQEAANSVVNGLLMKANINVADASARQKIAQIAQNQQGLDQIKVEQQIHQVLMNAGARLMDKQAEYMLYNSIMQGVGTVIQGIGTIGKTMK